MGACISSGGGVEVTEHDKHLHKQAEKELKEVSSVLVVVVDGADSHVGQGEIGEPSQGPCASQVLFCNWLRLYLGAVTWFW